MTTRRLIITAIAVWCLAIQMTAWNSIIMVVISVFVWGFEAGATWIELKHLERYENKRKNSDRRIPKQLSRREREDEMIFAQCLKHDDDNLIGDYHD